MLPLGERMRKLQMHYKSVGQKWGDSLQPFPLMCVSDWLKNSEFMSSAVVLMIKCRAASQVGSTLILSGTVLLLTVCTFYTEVVSASCSELTAVCCNVASRLHSWGGWIWCNSLLLQRQAPLISGAKKYDLPAAPGMFRPCPPHGHTEWNEASVTHCLSQNPQLSEGRRVATGLPLFTCVFRYSSTTEGIQMPKYKCLRAARLASSCHSRTAQVSCTSCHICQLGVGYVGNTQGSHGTRYAVQLSKPSPMAQRMMITNQ